MKSEDLPKYIQPLRMAEHGVALRGQLDLSLFSRLIDSLADSEGLVSIDLYCGKDTERLRYISGNLEVTLHLQCQRCLKRMDYPLHVKVSLSPVWNEAAGNKLPDRYEPLLITEDKLLLLPLVEDELLLSLPIAPNHAGEECPSE